MKKYERTLRALAEQYGCSLEKTRGSHYKFSHPDGWFVFTASSPSDRAGLRNLESDLRRKAAGAWR